MLESRTPVAQLVLDHAECAPVLQAHHIDFCCHGERTLDQACAELGLDQGRIVAELERAIAARPERVPNPRVMSTTSLVAHLIAAYHDPLRVTLPFVRGLSAKVARVHGERNPKLLDLSALVGQLVETLGPHLEVEERTLFPMLMAKPVDAERARAELAQMRDEHEAVGQLLERIRAASDDYAVPEWACGSYRTLFAELLRLEGEVLRHVHLENHVLLPRFAGEPAQR